MALRLKVGTVISQGDITKTGKFTVAFKLADSEGTVEEPVRYVSPYGNNDAAFVAIPMAGSQVLCAYEDDLSLEGDDLAGYYYLGSVMGAVPGLNRGIPSQGPPKAPNNDYVPKDKQGTFGPPREEYQTGMMEPNAAASWPSAFKDMYDGKGVIPEALGLTNHRGDAFKMASRYNSTELAKNPFQDYAIGIQSGAGKRIQAVDSPIVDGIVMTNEHRGKDFFIWSTGLSKESPFAEGEYHMRTHGPVNMYTLMNRFHIWVEDGLNVEIENKSTGKQAYGDTSTNNDGRLTAAGDPATGLGDPGTGGYEASRQGVFGNETTGCIQLLSHHNNISLRADAQDSVIFVNSPGPHSRVIVESGGSVDIVAEGKVTIQSNTEVEINAPVVDINGSDSANMNGGVVNIDGGPNIFLNSNEDGGGYTA
jgi:hypothetical protein